MTNINIKSKEDLELFNQILNDNIAMLFGDNDVVIKKLFKEKVMERLESVEIHGWDYKDNDINESVHGLTKFSDDGYTSIKMYGLDHFDGDKKYIDLIYSHELWHALMVIFNHVYGSSFKRSADLEGYKYDVSNYSGFFKCDDDGYERTSGYYMTDNLCQLLALAIVKKKNNDDFIIDDLFNYSIDDELLTSPVDDFITFFQMFTSAFSLTSDEWMSKNYQLHKGILESTVNKTNILPNNIFITESMRNPIAIMDEFNKYVTHTSYLTLLSQIDRLYDKYLRAGVLDARGFMQVTSILSEFVNKRLYDYAMKSLLSEDEYKSLIDNFNQLRKSFMKEIKVYKVTNAKKKFKKAVKKLLK